MSHEPEFVTTNGKERGPDDACIVSCGIGPEYQEGLHSTRLHCEVNVPEAWRLFYRDYPFGCLHHVDEQYAFKIWAMRRAIAAGFRFVVWMDSTFQPIASMAPLWERLRTDGWYIPKQGSAMLGSWCTDAFVKNCYPEVGVELGRDWLMKKPLVYSGLVALDMHSLIGRKIWERWFELYSAGLFNGPHRNVPGQDVWTPWGLKWQGHCSHDPRCEGHRHDEAALSWVLHELGLEPMTLGFLTMEYAGGFIGHHVPLVVPLQWARPYNGEFSGSILL